MALPPGTRFGPHEVTAQIGAGGVENSAHYFLALRQAGVPAEMHVFEQGPHGVGLASDDAVLSPWSGLLATWLRGRGVIT